VTPTLSHRLGIDFGTTHTVAVIEIADGRAQPLLFDSSPLLSSAVFADAGGRLLTGRDGERSARLDPTRYEPNPKRRIDEAIILLGNDEYPLPRVISAVLTRVAAEAVRASGGAPAQTVLTYPANWGSHRKDVLVQAASAAGLTSVTVVPEPVAAAAHFTGVLGRTVNPGESLAVYDFGAGTFDASIVRLRPDGAWELLASEGLDDVGGLDLDAVLVDRIGRVVGHQDPQRWHQLVNPTDTIGRRASRTFWDDVRAAKEQLSRTPTAAVHVPLFDTDTHLTREEFESAARPLLDRTVELMATLVNRAGPTRLAGMYLVGGSSRMPAVAARLSQELGVPTQLADPDLAVAKGAALYGQKKAIERLVVRDLVTRGQLRDGAPVGSATPADLHAACARLAPAFDMTTEQVRRTVEIEVLNVCSRGFGVLAIGLTDLEAVFLVHRNDRLPVAVRRSFGTVRDDQETVTVRVVEQGGGVESTDPYVNKIIAEASITGIPRGYPAGSQVEITLAMGFDGILELTALHEGMGDRPLRVQIETSAALSQAEVARERAQVANTRRRNP